MEPAQAYELMDTPEAQATIYGVIRRLGIDARHPEYEDYAQEAWIIFYLWCLEANLTIYSPTEIRKIGFTRMYRRLMNLRYREIRKRDTQMMIADQSTFDMLPGPTNYEHWELAIHGIKLTKRQRQIMWYLIAGQGNQQWVASQLKISRKTVKRELVELRLKLAQFKLQLK